MIFTLDTNHKAELKRLAHSGITQILNESLLTTLLTTQLNGVV